MLTKAACLKIVGLSADHGLKRTRSKSGVFSSSMKTSAEPLLHNINIFIRNKLQPETHL